MPRHGAGLGAGNFPAASKLLMRYEHDRVYKQHLQKLASVKPKLDLSEPKKQNHLILRLKQIQKEEERQAEIDHENKLLLSKMTHIIKYHGSIDNWNSYESRSLNFPYRERQNEELAQENISIARRLETVKPKLEINKWEQDYQKHQYLKKLWSESVKDFGEFTPRRFRSRISQTRSLDNSIDESNDEDMHSSDKAHRKQLPTMDKSTKVKYRKTRSESNGPVSLLKDVSKGQQKTKFPKISAQKMEDHKTGVAQEQQDDNVDVAQLFRVAKMLGKPEDIITKTLISKTHKQRMVLKDKFRQKYELDLITELKNGLGVHWEPLINALLQERGIADCYTVFDALTGTGTKQNADINEVAEVLCTRDNASIAELRESYRKEFSISLEEDIADRTKPPIKTVLLTLQKGQRDESTTVDEEAAKQDAQSLFEAGDGRWDNENGLFMKLLSDKSFGHMQVVFAEFKHVSQGQDILSSMKRDCAKDYYSVLNVIVKCMGSPLAHYADLLHKHMQPSDPVFISILTTRSEVDMPLIRKQYKKVYHVDITEDIKNIPNETQKCLIALASKVPPGMKKNGKEKKKANLKDGTKDPVGSKKSLAKKTEPMFQGEDSSADHVREYSSTKSASKSKSSGKKMQQSKSKSDSQENVAMKHETQNNRSGIKSNTNYQGTVKPAGYFKPEEDCEKLHSALSGGGGTEQVVRAIIPKRSNQQRQVLKITYEKKYKKNLMIDLESELKGDNEELVLALMMPPTEYDVYVLHEAVEGLGYAEATLIGILCTRSSQELNATREHYMKVYKTNMDADITRDSYGAVQTLLLQLVHNTRQAGTAVNMDQAEKDAKELHKIGVPSPAFVNVITKQNHFQVKATIEEYKKIAGEDIYASLTKASIGDNTETYINIVKAVEDPIQFYTEKLHACFNAMGTNDNLLIRIVIPRSEIDLHDIKERYMELYKQNLYDVVNNQCSGDYKTILLAIIDK